MIILDTDVLTLVQFEAGEDYEALAATRPRRRNPPRHDRQLLTWHRFLTWAMEVIMAWDDYEVGDLELISGDITFDELHGAVQRIRKHYLQRFGRNPYLGELLYTLCRIAVDYAPPSVVEDLTLPPIENVLSSLTVPTHSDQFDPGHYEASIDEDDEVWISPTTESAGSIRLGDPVLRLQVEDNRPQEVVCRYTPLSPDISDAAAHCLIRLCALSDLLDYDLLDPGLVVRFEKQ